MIKSLSIFLLLLVLISCKQKEVTKTEKFIDKPLKEIEIPFQEYKVNAQKGDTLIYKTGSIILFPPSSFVNANGEAIKGEVTVRYREFVSPEDYYLSGIPMVYDSSETQYIFKSTAMFELVAYQNGEPVYVNQNNKPEINIARNSTEPSNLYILDTVGRNWIYKGTTIVTDVPEIRQGQNISKVAVDMQLSELVKPEKVTNTSPIIKIVVDPASFKELTVYDNLKFQLDAKEKNFDPKDAEEEWSNVELVKGKTRGTYVVRFSNGERTVSYNAKPVSEGKDYDKALKVYEQKLKEYETNRRDRLAKDEVDRTRYKADSIKNEQLVKENKRIEKLNKLIEVRNREIEKQNELISAENKKINEANQFGRIFYSFQVDGFGISNCDVAFTERGFPIVASFVDEQGGNIPVSKVAVFYKNLNGISRFNNDTLRFLKEDENMIFGISNERLAYLSYEDVKKLNLNPESKSQKFVLKVVSEKDNNYEFLKSVATRQ